MESNKLADEVRMKLLGLEWCPTCCIEIKPMEVANGLARAIKNIGFVNGQAVICPHCHNGLKETKPDDVGAMYPHKETK